MMGIEYIQALSNEAGVAARYQKLEPKIVADTPTLEEDLRSIPNLGDYVPDDWELVKTHFVDASGMGEAGEPALTFGAFQRVVRGALDDPDAVFAWGLVEQGQFQVYIGQFRFRSK